MTNLPQSAQRRLQAQAAGDHPDAGLLTAFAEQALNALERERVLGHLAACASCREIVALSLPEPTPAEEVNPLAPSWFRWPLLRWAAVAATAVIVWAAVSVLVPRTSKRDVAVEVSSNAKLAQEGSTPSAAPEPKVKVSPPPDQSSQLATRKVFNEVHATPSPATSNAPKERVARDQAVAKNDTLDVSGSAAKVQMRAKAVANAAEIPPPPPPSSAAASAAKKAPAMESAGYAGALAGTSPEAKRQTTTAVVAPKSGTVGGPLLKDSATALIAGTVTDPSGAVVPNARVKITNARTNTSTALRTDSAGTYRTPVTPGQYSVEAASPGMQTVKVTDVTVDGTVAQNITLHPAAATEAVEVSAAQAALPAPAAPPPAGRNAAKAETGQGGVAGGVVGGVVGGALARPQSTYKAWVPLRWRVTAEGHLEQTSDGSSWTRATNSPSAVFRAVSAFGLNVWAGAEGGALFHSTNDGHSWARVRVGDKRAPVSATITAIAVADAKSLTVTTSSGEQWSSHDGGAHWQLLNRPR